MKKLFFIIIVILPIALFSITVTTISRLSVQDLLICSTDNNSYLLPASFCYCYFNNLSDLHDADYLDQHAGLAFAFDIVPTQRKYKILERLLTIGVDINKPAAVDGLPPLHAAILLHDAKLVQFLLNHGANINVTDNNQHMNSTQLVEYLIQHNTSTDLLAIQNMLIDFD